MLTKVATLLLVQGRTNMKRFLILFSVLITLCYSSYGQAITYNAIATAYVTTTISQNVVFNDAMRQGGTFTMSVLAHIGGGRAGQSDTANVRIQFYNSAGGLMGTFSSSYNANLPNPNAVCGNPCIDTSVPWSTLTVSTTVDAVSAASIAYAKVSMYGIDGSYWAGDYGPWYRAPTFQLNGGGNLLYNPEFGPYNNITAQGWTSNPGFGACQGAWGGSNACIVNSDGVPGSSTVGLVANANGGGPDVNGGTTSGTAGGYNNTMSVTNAGTGATSGAPAGPTVVSTTNSNVTSTVNMGGGTTNTYSQPVTTVLYSDGTSTTTNNGTATLISSVTLGTAGITANQQSVVTNTQQRQAAITNITPNSVYIQQTGSNDTYNITQVGIGNTVDGATFNTSTGQIGYQTYAQFAGGNNNVTIRQGDPATRAGKNIVDVSVNGTGNYLNINQGTDANGLYTGLDTGDHYQFVWVTGGNNNITTVQQGTNYATQFGVVSVNGASNNIQTVQSGSAGHQSFIGVSGSYNNVTVGQSGTSSNYSSVTTSGNNNTATVTQTNGGNNANINLINAGAPASVNLTQTGNQSYSVTQTCYTSACGTITLRQGN